MRDLTIHIVGTDTMKELSDRWIAAFRSNRAYDPTGIRVALGSMTCLAVLSPLTSW